MKRIWPVALALVAAVAVGYFADDAFQARRSLSKAKADHAELKKAFTAEHEIGQAHIAELTNEVGHLTSVIEQKDAEAAQYVDKISTYRAEIAALQAAEPVQPELEKEPLVINLRAQVASVTNAFDLSQNVVRSQALEIDALKVKCVALEGIGAEWKAEAEREYALRVAAEEMFKLSERHRKISKYLTYAGAGAALVLGYLAGK